MVQRSARNSFGYDASSLLSLKYQSLSITKFYCKRDFINYSKEATRYEYASFDNIKQKE